VPLVFAFSRYKLGMITKFKGQMASAVGIFNFQGANDEFNNLVILKNKLREEFYRELSKEIAVDELKVLKRENRFLDWNLFEKVKFDSQATTSYL
jgi:hypothetical protein